MDKNKQIEEMAKHCTYYHNGECFASANQPTECDLMCEMFGVFANLEMAGYRKQSEWISVAERLPENNRVVVLYCRSTTGTGDVKITGSCLEGQWRFSTALNTMGFALNEFLHQYVVTHWHELPKRPEELSYGEDS